MPEAGRASKGRPAGNGAADVTAVINCHREGLLPVQACRSVRRAAERAAAAGLSVELLLVLDRPDDLTREVVRGLVRTGDRVLEIGAGNLSLARNAAVAASTGRTVAFLDADDLWGEDWLERGYHCLEGHGFGAVAVHPECSVLFGEQRLVWHHFGMDAPDFRIDYCMFDNYFSALAFAPREVFERHRYRPIAMRAGFGYEDWSWLCETIRHGVRHLVVPGTLHAIRRRRDSLLMSSRSQRLLMSPTPLFSGREVDWEERIIAHERALAGAASEERLPPEPVAPGPETTEPEARTNAATPWLGRLLAGLRRLLRRFAATDPAPGSGPGGPGR
jgi:glycosyltransferase involved in cell wall biosynthesis